MVKRGPKRLKIGVQSRFGPNSTGEFEAVFRKKFGVAYCIPIESNVTLSFIPIILHVATSPVNPKP